MGRDGSVSLRLRGGATHRGDRHTEWQDSEEQQEASASHDPSLTATGSGCSVPRASAKWSGGDPVSTSHLNSPFVTARISGNYARNAVHLKWSCRSCAWPPQSLERSCQSFASPFPSFGSAPASLGQALGSFGRADVSLAPWTASFRTVTQSFVSPVQSFQQVNGQSKLRNRRSKLKSEEDIGLPGNEPFEAPAAPFSLSGHERDTMFARISAGRFVYLRGFYYARPLHRLDPGPVAMVGVDRGAYCGLSLSKSKA